MSFLSKIRGTIESLFQLGLGGPQLKANGAAIEARNAADAAFAVVRVATPVANEDAATKLYVDGMIAGGGLKTKSGKALAAAFAGNPKKATITFATAFLDTNYAVALTPIITAGGTLYAPNVETQLAGSFVINMGVNNIGSLLSVGWIAVASGETP